MKHSNGLVKFATLMTICTESDEQTEVVLCWAKIASCLTACCKKIFHNLTVTQKL